MTKDFLRTVELVVWALLTMIALLGIIEQQIKQERHHPIHHAKASS